VFFAIFWAKICCGTRTLLSRDSRCKAQKPAHGLWIIILDNMRRGCEHTEARARWMDNGCAVMRSTQGLKESHWDAVEKGDKSVIASIVVTVNMLIGILPQKNRFDRTTASPFLGHSNVTL
jgi:hypothetical protein